MEIDTFNTKTLVPNRWNFNFQLKNIRIRTKNVHFWLQKKTQSLSISPKTVYFSPKMIRNDVFGDEWYQFLIKNHNFWPKKCFWAISTASNYKQQQAIIPFKSSYLPLWISINFYISDSLQTIIFIKYIQKLSAGHFFSYPASSWRGLLIPPCGYYQFNSASMIDERRKITRWGAR